MKAHDGTRIEEMPRTTNEPRSAEEEIARRFSNMVRKKSHVLICGRPTTELLEQLINVRACNVQIAYPDSHEHGKAYAHVCEVFECDLESETWTANFQDVRYDYVLLPNTLESIRNPAMLLSNCAMLLTSKGSICASLHNASSNSIIGSLLGGSTGYRNPNTIMHDNISLFAPKDLHPLFAEGGLGITHVDYVMGNQTSVQRSTWHPQANGLETKALAHNPWGRLDHIILEAQRTASIAPEGIAEISPPEGCSSIYPCTIFYAREDKPFSAERCTRSSVQPEYLFETIVDVKELRATRLRYDPIEGVPCLVENLCIRADYDEIKPQTTNGFVIEDAYLFSTTDPQIHLTIPFGTRLVQITAQVTPLLGREGHSIAKAYEYAIRQRNNERQLYRAYKQDAEREQVELKDRLSAQVKEAKKLIKQNDDLQQKNASLEQKLSATRHNEASLKWTLRHACRLVLKRLHLKK